MTKWLETVARRTCDRTEWPSTSTRVIWVTKVLTCSDYGTQRTKIHAPKA